MVASKTAIGDTPDANSLRKPETAEPYSLGESATAVCAAARARMASRRTGLSNATGSSI